MRFTGRRAPDWRRKLELYVAAAASRRFDFGEHDCAMFAAGAVAAMTGADPAAPYRGRYGTLNEGLELLRAAGFGDHLDMADSLFEEIPVARARPGDLAAVAAGEGDALGVVQGEHVYLVGPGGLRLVPLTDASRAWRVD
jgi:hypothetical protein